MMVPQNLLSSEYADLTNPPSATSSTSSPSTDAAAVWTEHTATNGRTYFYNRVTKQSTWSKPDELKTPDEVMFAIVFIRLMLFPA